MTGNITVYASTEFNNIRAIPISDYVISINALTTKRGMYYNMEITHPTIELDDNVLSLIDFNVGDYINYELNNIVFMRTYITGILPDQTKNNVTLKCNDVIYKSSDLTCEDLYEYCINDPHDPDNGLHYNANNTNDYFNNISILVCLKYILVLIGYEYSDIVCNIGNEYSQFYSYSPEDSIPSNRVVRQVFSNLAFSLTMLNNTGKSSYEDDSSTDLLTLLIDSAMALKLRIFHNNNNVIIDKYNEIYANPTICDYKCKQIERKPLNVSFEVADRGTSDERHLYDLYTATWSGTKTYNSSKPLNKENCESISFEANFYIFCFMPGYNYAIGDLLQDTDNPWEHQLLSVFNQYCNDVFLEVLPPCNKICEISLDNDLLWDTNFIECKIDVKNSKSSLKLIELR